MPDKICMVIHERYPDDIRVSKEASALIEAGYEVHVLCLRNKAKPKELHNGIHIHSIALAQSHFWLGIWDIIIATAFLHPMFYRRLRKLHAKFEFSAIHVHDLPLSKTALKFRKRFPDVKVVLDQHENYPEALNIWYSWKRNPVIRFKNKLFFSFKRWLNYEKRMLSMADGVIVVVEEMKQRIVAAHEVPEGRVAIVSNTEPLDFLKQTEYPDIYSPYEKDFIVAYTGNVGPHRGVDVAINGMAHLKEYPQIRLEITGGLSNDTKTWLTRLIDENGLEGNVSVNGYQPFDKFYSYMKFADVNIIPHKKNGHTDHTIPHKLFQAMLVSKPVLVSSAAPLKRTVEATNSGLVFEAHDPADFAKKVLQLYQNQENAASLGRNGFSEASDGSVSWKRTSTQLVDFYNDLLKPKEN